MNALPRRQPKVADLVFWIAPIAVCLAGLRYPLWATGLPAFSVLGLLLILGFVVAIYFAPRINTLVVGFLVLLAAGLVISAIIFGIIELTVRSRG